MVASCTRIRPEFRDDGVLRFAADPLAVAADPAIFAPCWWTGLVPGGYAAYLACDEGVTLGADMSGFFGKEASQSYDERNRNLTAIADNMHFLIRLVLRGLPQDSRVLCVGVGTGAEILSLAAAYPGFRFVGVDPSGDMLDVCRDRLSQAGVLERCQLVEGYVEDIGESDRFDAVLAVLVGHFVSLGARAGFYGAMSQRLVPGGILLTSELSHDLDGPAFAGMLENWSAVQELGGATADALVSLPQTLRSHLTVLPPDRVEALLREAGIAVPVRFFQSFMITGWWGRKAA